MSKLVKISLLTIFLVFATISVSATISITSAQGEEVPTASEAVNLDENIKAKDLGIGEPWLLPDSPLYFLKNWGRKIRNLFTLSPIRKAELQMKFASERLIESKKLIEKGKIELAKENLRKHNLDLEKTREILERKKEDPQVESAEKKMAEKVVKHQKLLDNLEKAFPLKDSSEIRETKEKIIETYLNIEKPEKVSERLKEVLEKEKGSDFREFKNLQILERVKEKAPESAQAAIEKVIENRTKTFTEKFEALPFEKREKIEEYLVEIGGEETTILEIVRKIEKEEISSNNKEKLERAKDKIIEKLEEKLQMAETQGIKGLEEKALKRLEKGEIEKLKVIKDLEEKISLRFLPEVLETKKVAEEKLLEKLEKMPVEEKEEFRKKIAKEADYETLEILKEDKEILPPERKKEVEEIEKEIKEKLKEELRRAEKEPGALEKKVQKFFKGKAKESKLIEEMPIAPSLKNEVKEKFLEKLERKIDQIEKPKELEEIEKEIAEENVIITPQISKTIEIKKERLEKKISKEEVEKDISETEKLLSRLENKIAEEKEKVLTPEYKELITLKELAEKKIREAKEALKDEKIGEAFGKMTAAQSKIKTSLKTLDKMKQKEKIEEKRIEEFQKELPGVEIEVPENITLCPLPKKPECPDGILEKIKDDSGCIKFICKKIEKPEEIVCPTLWDPVCGVDDKTYSNECVAEKIAKVKIAYKGECKKERKCAKEGEKVNRNPLLGAADLKCCPGLKEIRVSKSYSICIKVECEKDEDCPEPKCLGVKSRCVEGKCVVPKCEEEKEIKVEKEEESPPPSRLCPSCLKPSERFKPEKSMPGKPK